MAKLTLFKRDDGDLYEAIEGTVAYKILSADSRFVIVQGDDHDVDKQQTESDEQPAKSKRVSKK